MRKMSFLVLLVVITSCSIIPGGSENGVIASQQTRMGNCNVFCSENMEKFGCLSTNIEYNPRNKTCECSLLQCSDKIEEGERTP